MKHQDTEPIEGETWCTYCKVPVDEWVVSYEPNSEGYDKIRRCPNCNEKCFDHANVGFGLFLFVVGMAIAFGVIALLDLLKDVEILFWLSLDRHFPDNSSVPMRYLESFGGWAFAGALVFAALFAGAGMKRYKKYVRRHGPKK